VDVTGLGSLLDESAALLLAVALGAGVDDSAVDGLVALVLGAAEPDSVEVDESGAGAPGAPGAEDEGDPAVVDEGAGLGGTAA
jgi:hypothetical protein